MVQISVAGGITLNFGSQAFTTSATAGYIKNGAGTLTLAGGTYAGGFTLNTGTVAVAGVNAMGAGGSLTINGGTIRSNSTTARDLSGKYAGGISIGGDFTLGDGTNNGALTFTNSLALGAATRSIIVNSAASFGGVISGAANVGLTKSGTGTLTLSGANTYDGVTTITAGPLSINSFTNGGVGLPWDGFQCSCQPRDDGRNPQLQRRQHHHRPRHDLRGSHRQPHHQHHRRFREPHSHEHHRRHSRAAD